MRGMDERSGSLVSYVDLEGRVPGSHPLRAIRRIVNESLTDLTGRLEALYSPVGRPSIPPERLLRALLLQAFFSIRSERQLMERLDFDLSFRWFVGLGIDDAVWDHSTFSKNRDRLLDGDVAARFLGAVLERPKVKRLLSTEHFSIDGTLIEAWASMKSFKAKEPPQGASTSDPGERPATEGRNAEVDFRGEKRSNETHASTSDPDARLYRKSRGQGATLCFIGHVLMENRNGLVIDAELTRATGHAERFAALEMIKGVTGEEGTTRPLTVGGDKGFDTADFVMELRELGAVPHVAQNTTGRRSAIDGRTTRHPGYAVSQCIRKRIEEVFGWTKTIAGQRKTRFRGLSRVRWAFTFAMAAYNLVRLPKLLGAVVP
jgi:transposase